MDLPSAQAGTSRTKTSLEGTQQYLPATEAQSLGKAFLLGWSPANSPTSAFPEASQIPAGDGAQAREAKGSTGFPDGGCRLESQAARLSGLVLSLLRRRRPRRLGGSALSAIDHPNSFRYFLSHLLFKKNLMFSIIHPSQKIIDRARNENLSHIL